MSLLQIFWQWSVFNLNLKGLTGIDGWKEEAKDEWTEEQTSYFLSDFDILHGLLEWLPSIRY